MNIAIIACESKNLDLISFLSNYKHSLSKVNLFATKTTSQIIDNIGLEVINLIADPQNDDTQIATLISEGKIDAIIFFRDSFDDDPFELDFQMLMRICVVYDIPMATNPTTAAILLKGSPVLDYTF